MDIKYFSRQIFKDKVTLLRLQTPIKQYGVLHIFYGVVKYCGQNVGVEQ